MAPSKFNLTQLAGGGPPLNTLLSSHVRCMVNEGLLALLERFKDLHCLLKNLGFGEDVGVYSEFISPMPYHPHHQSHEFRVHPSLMRHLDQLRDV
nr:hypothetical protein CFP56_74418 [Quercus suber]POE60354.1 hypothetical protein CFP56_57331 [Quercus suber]